ncbi:hypothetical protein EYF80_035846 [Liparis tanakae]|uniref:Uncharacterized protein n=1 Tax=Liparis tanakae TaxID=230148 RepID=A0A4Z2GK56_9TELE|nr:hypothetical protein EYF80_035846 [Liparis tanakae]
MDSEALNPAVSAMEPEGEAGPRRKTSERRLVWRRMRLLLGCLTASADLLVDELPVDEVDLMKRGQCLTNRLFGDAAGKPGALGGRERTSSEDNSV